MDEPGAPIGLAAARASGPSRRLDPTRVALAYVLATTASVVAVYIAIALEPRLGSSAFALLFAPVALAAWYGGLGPGLVATVLCVLAVDYYFEIPLYSLRIASVSTGLRLAVFLLVAFMISSLSGRLRAALWQAESARRAAENSAAIVASSQDAIVGVDLDGRIGEWNKGATEVFGYPGDQVIGRPISALQPPDRSADLARVVERLTAGERFGLYETLGRHHDGRQIDLAVVVSPVHGADQQIVGASIIARDVSEQKRAGEVRANLAAIVSSSDDAIFGTTLDGIITSWNAGAERLYGYRPEEVIGRGRALLVPDDRQQELARILEQVRRGERVDHLRTERVRKDGRSVVVVVTIAPIRDPLGHVIGAATIARDARNVTQEQELVELARQIAREPDPGRALGRVLEVARRLLQADTASALVWDVGRRGLLPLRSDPPGPDVSTLTPPGEGAAGRAVQDRAAVLMNDYPSQRGATAGAIRAGVRAALGTPVMVGGDLVGALVAGSLAEQSRFTRTDAELLELLGALAAPSIAALRPTRQD